MSVNVIVTCDRCGKNIHIYPMAQSWPGYYEVFYHPMSHSPTDPAQGGSHHYCSAACLLGKPKDAE